ncbi:helix-turn-helix domain-containing protein [Variovorax ginsengisoli]|uniref:Cytoskeleton protein RodZ n=1 Tax=Variovorax ginsengisoli TaxID=363844 RepID=A0ABT9SF79_9BURK|nr:helix-turn-helix domain-containing protein [Variovorax ginsengisoli]MDP9903024.1 cytoskeleton protein RodZ [Variovorax ginsengisoli]
MIERASEFAASSEQPTVAGDTQPLTAGDMLRQAREAHGLQIDVVAAALKVPVKKLQSLEDDDIAALPDPVFARALAASVARALHIDPAPVLAKLPGAVRPGLADADQTISSHIRSGAPRSGRGASWQPSRAVWIFVALLLVGAAALLWLPSSVFERLGATVSRITSSQDKASSTGGLPPGEAPPPGTVVEPAVAAVEPSAPPAPAAPAATEPAAPAAAVPASSDAVVFVAREDSWVTVTEAGGKQLLRRTIKAGETVGLSGKLPLSVVVGRASGMSVQVQGKPFDLASVTKSGGVARFEVKP